MGNLEQGGHGGKKDQKKKEESTLSPITNLYLFIEK